MIIPEISLTKSLVGAPVPATSGTVGNFELTYDLEITNTGNDPLSSVTLTEDLATQYGGAFVRIVGDPAVVATTASDDPEINAAYDGGAIDAQLFDNAVPNTNLLGVNESVTVRIVIEVDPDAATATYVNGSLENQATTSGVGAGSGSTVDDLSDDPTDLAESDGDPLDPSDNDNNPDDPNNVRFPRISLEKTLASSPVPASSGTAGNFDATYEFTLSNAGTTSLDLLTLTEDFATQFGGAFEAVIGTPSITASTATTDPAINAAYDGGTNDAGVFDGASGRIDPGQTITVQITVELDPDSPTAVYDGLTGDGNTDLENQATTTGTDSGDPNGPTTVDDASDDPTDATNNDGDPSNPGDPSDDDGEPDDPVSLILPDITLTKTLVGVPVPASSATPGNFDVTYQFVLTNTGNDNLTSLSLIEDFAAQYGGAFVSIVGTPSVTGATATDNPEISFTYDGGLADAELFDNSGTNTNLLAIGESVVIEIVAEVDPDSATAIFVNGELENQATTAGTGLNSGSLTMDASDDPSDSTNLDPNGDNNPDDPTIVSLPTDAGFGVAKAGQFLSPTLARYTYTIQHFGDAQALNLSMPEDLDAVFGAGNYTVAAPVVASGPTSIGTNANFDGSADIEMLSTGSYISPGETSVITIDVTVLNIVDTQGNGLGIYDNMVTVTGQNPEGDLVQDESTDGFSGSVGGGGTATQIVAAFAEITGSVYSDANGNGDFDAADAGIIGVEITLTGTDAFGNPISLTTLTDANGFYSFDSLAPGDYVITQTQPPQFIDGDDNIGTLGGTTSNDQFAVTIGVGESGSFENDFGERGLNPASINKGALLASTPDDYWSNLNASGSGTLGLWVPFAAESGGAVKAILIDADSIEVDVFDENMNLLNPAQQGDSEGTWVVHEGQRYFARLRGADSNFDFDLRFGVDAGLPVSLDLSDNVVIAVGTPNDDSIELILGAQTHLLTMADYQFEFDASVIDTFNIGSSTGNDTIRVVGTDLDDVGNVLDNHGTLTSDAYTVNTYTFDSVIFDGQGGNDYTQIFGSLGDDTLQGLPQDSTLTTPDHVMQMLGFERVDSYGRGGDDYASMYGTQGDDSYWTFETYEVLQGENMTMRTIGWDRVDAFGRGGHDTTRLFDTPGDDHFYAFEDFAVMQSPHLHAVVKGFEDLQAEANNGGNDTAHLWGLGSEDHFFARDNIATVTGDLRNTWVIDFENVEAKTEENETPTVDLSLVDFVLDSLGDWF